MSGIETVRISEERRNGMVYCRERWAMVVTTALSKWMRSTQLTEATWATARRPNNLQSGA